ncbi:MAG TPA: efflux RND transporter periplasmic adaptor subunit [Acidobacteriota bacterium]|nr:efflux RND transporter periplasmic adaptor subunit [Acidobacteriota bacterium]
MARQRWYRSKYLWLTLFLTMGLGGVGAWEFFTVKADKPTYIFGVVDRGDIVSQVLAQGTLAAVTTVDVGSQVSGTIAELHADFNSEVKKGQVLAKLNQDLFLADVSQQDANVHTAEAQLNDDVAAIAAAQADLQKAKVDVLDKQHKYGRQKELFDEDLISRDDYETAQAALDSSTAAEKAAEATLESAKSKQKEDEARLVQARGALETAKLNLEHTIITSPISGTVINRTVDVGQTVAASFSAPVLFSIGEDLTKMQVNTSIDEADVGSLKTGMEASFTVDAYPGRDFAGNISQIRLAATTVNNVVTYDAVIDVPNPDLLLKPGMTANVRIVVDRVNGALKIPNSALRFKPTLADAQMEEAFKKAGEERFWSFYSKTRPQASTPVPLNAMSGARGPGGGSPLQRDSGNSTRTVMRGKRVPLWVMAEDMSLRPVVAKLGITDGVSTQIDSPKLKQGDRIIVGYEFDPNRASPIAGSRPPGFGGPFGFRH